MTPGSFIPAAERYGLMPQVDRWVIRTALAHLAARGARADAELCSINLSGTSVADPDLLPFIHQQIDGAFVSEMRDDAVSAALVESINTVGHAVGALTVAEFVEDQHTLERLCAMGVDYAQGFVIARPRPLDAEQSYAVSLPEATASAGLVAGP